MKKNNRITVFSSDANLFKFAANDFSQRAIAAVQDKGIFSVVLAGGNTPKLFFDALTSGEFKKSIPWQKVLFFFGDERYVPANDRQSNYHMAYEHLFSKVPVNLKNIYRIPTEFNDPTDAVKEYEQTLRNIFHIQNNTCPEFDCIYLGLGDNAHTASLMPFSEPVKNHAENNQLVASLFVAELNMYRITLTANAINNSKAIIFLVTGADKATAVWEVLEGPRDPERYPAQLIHCVNGETIWYIASAAAAKLTWG